MSTTPTMPVSVARILSGSNRFAPVRVDVHYSSHPTTGAGRWVITMTRPGMRTVRLVRPYSYKGPTGLAAVRGIMRQLMPGAVIVQHVPDVLAGYRFECWIEPEPTA